MAAQPLFSTRKHHVISDYPAVKVHFPCNETDGLSVTDEVNGIAIDVSSPLLKGSMNFTTKYSVTLKRNAIGEVPVTNPWPIFSRTKYMISFLCCRPLLIGDAVNGLMPGGSNSLGESFTMGTRLGLHSSVTDTLGNYVSFTDSGGLDETKMTTAGEDCLLVMIYRPAGSLIECRCYNADTTLKWSGTYTNTPGVLTADLQPPQTAGLLFDTNYPNNSGYWHQAQVYQHIVYEFNTEPTNLLHAIQWHCTAPRTGQKSPYPGWKNVT